MVGGDTLDHPEIVIQVDGARRKRGQPRADVPCTSLGQIDALCAPVLEVIGRFLVLAQAAVRKDSHEVSSAGHAGGFEHERSLFLLVSRQASVLPSGLEGDASRKGQPFQPAQVEVDVHPLIGLHGEPVDPRRFRRCCAFSHVGGQVERFSRLKVHANRKIAFRADGPTKVLGQRMDEVVRHATEGDQVAEKEGQALNAFLITEVREFEPIGIHAAGHGHFDLSRERFNHGATVQTQQGIVVRRGVLKQQPERCRRRSLHLHAAVAFRTERPFLQWREATHAKHVRNLHREAGFITVHREANVVTVHRQRRRGVAGLNFNRLNRRAGHVADLRAEHQFELGGKTYQTKGVALVAVLTTVGDGPNRGAGLVNEALWLLHQPKLVRPIGDHRGLLLSDRHVRSVMRDVPDDEGFRAGTLQLEEAFTGQRIKGLGHTRDAADPGAHRHRHQRVNRTRTALHHANGGIAGEEQVVAFRQPWLVA